MDGELGLLDSPTLLTRGALGKNHILLSLVVFEAKKFSVSADVVSRKAFNNVVKCPKLGALLEILVEAPGDRIPRPATLHDGGGQAVSLRAQGSTSNKSLCSKR